MKFSKLFSLGAVLAAMLLAGTGANATSGILFPGQTTSVNVVILDRRSWATGVDSLGYAVAYYPFMQTAGTLITRGNDATYPGYVLLQQAPNSVAYSNQYNVTASADIKSVQTFLGQQSSSANDMEVTFTQSWSGSNLTISVSSWSLFGLNLVPYGVDQTECNLTATATCFGTLLLQANTGFSCQNTAIPGLEACFAAGKGCLAWMAQAVSSLVLYCNTEMSVLVSIVCTDGTTGATALCNYIAQMKPSGVAGTVIVSANADGTGPMTASGGGSTNTSAVDVSLGVAAAAAVAFLAL